MSAPRKRITIDAPGETVILAARHLDATEGPVQVGAVVDTAARSAITTVLRYISKAHNSDAVEEPTATDSPRQMLRLDCSTCGTTGITMWTDHAKACPGPPRDESADPLARIRDLEACLWENSDAREMPVSAVCHSIANNIRIALAGDDHSDIGEIQITRHLGRGLTVDTAPRRSRIALTVLADAKWGATMVGDDQINIADQVLYRVVGYDPGTASLVLELVEDWRPAARQAEAGYEELKARWQAIHAKTGPKGKAT